MGKAAAWSLTILLASAIVLTSAAYSATTAPALPPAQTSDDLDARYQQVLAVLKNPSASGALVAETGPDSAGRAAGIRPGDIITRYSGTAITSDDDLRSQIAEEVAPQEGLIPVIDVRVPVIVRRGEETIELRVPKGALGMTILTVTAGVPGALNPPPSPREKLLLEWDKLPHEASGAHTAWTTLDLHKKSFAIERTTLTLRDGSGILDVITAEFDGSESCCHIAFSASDNQKIPGFALDTLTYRAASGVSGERRGLFVHGTIRRAEGATTDVTAPTTLNAVPIYAIAVVAAALPHEADLVMPLDTISELDLQTRVGYCLATRGQKTLTVGEKPTAAWCVQLLHFARPEMTFWFTDARELIHADLGMGLTAGAASPDDIARFKAEHERE